MYVRELAEKVVTQLRNTGAAELTQKQIVSHRDLNKQLEAAIKLSGLSVSAEYDFIGARIIYRREDG